jgi:hypothetical protein
MTALKIVTYKQTELWAPRTKEDIALAKKKSRLFVAGINKLIEADVQIQCVYPDEQRVRVDRVDFVKDGAARFIMVWPYPDAIGKGYAPLALDIETLRVRLLVQQLEE